MSVPGISARAMLVDGQERRRRGGIWVEGLECLEVALMTPTSLARATYPFIHPRNKCALRRT